jgi:aspartyl-tRNA(Asn)/glutamyl-tRNA(Gln) amidotransferase subunit A
VAFGSSLDQIGVFGRRVNDAARVLEVISGHDPNDATSEDRPPMTAQPASENLRGVVFGMPSEYFPAELDPGVRAGVDRAASALRRLGATIREVSLPHARFAVPTYYIVAPAEAAANLARYDGVRYGPRKAGTGGDVASLYRATRGAGFGAEVRRRILTGTYVLSSGYYDAYYQKAQQVRALLADDFRRVFEDQGVHYLLTPTTPSPAFKAGEKVDDPVAMYLADIFTCSMNLAGVPALSLPGGRSDGLPVGVQLVGPHFSEPELFGVAATLERVLDPAAEVR